MPKSLVDDLPQDEVFEPDEEIEERLDFEDELEEKYGLPNDDSPKEKTIGPGFAKQKQVMEQNRFYQTKKKKVVKLTDRTKK